jgi:DNA-binding CsgD family transcriptional regulator
MARKDFTPEDLAQLKRQQEAATLYLGGKTQWEIAGHLGVSQSTVRRDLAAVLRISPEEPPPPAA